MKKSFEIIIVLYNEVYCFERLILNLSELRFDFKVIFVINGDLFPVEIINKTEIGFIYKVIKLKNELSIGSARNFGMNKSDGYWIMFMDPDDRIYPNYLNSSILSLLQADLNIFRYSCERYDLNDVPHKSDDFIFFKNFGSVENNNYDVDGFIWRFIFKRNFLTHHKIVFNEITISEDLIFTVDCLKNNPKIEYFDELLIRQYDNKRSLTNSYENKQAARDLLKALNILEESLKSHYHQELINYFFNRLLMTCLQRSYLALDMEENNLTLEKIALKLRNNKFFEGTALFFKEYEKNLLNLIHNKFKTNEFSDPYLIYGKGTLAKYVLKVFFNQNSTHLVHGIADFQDIHLFYGKGLRVLVCVNDVKVARAIKDTIIESFPIVEVFYAINMIGITEP